MELKELFNEAYIETTKALSEGKVTYGVVDLREMITTSFDGSEEVYAVLFIKGGFRKVNTILDAAMKSVGDKK